ncbi:MULTISPECIES: ABC transporter permease [Uliginosibacterium]|uniref:ABC transporter permease n=1 Tax=Uliginosibacterium aquaticum TaxID=2731212 RepID=A0ABX2IHR2_9RHOO|nr:MULTISPECIES: ABC transporter permease [Uliginosibacterium]MDO6387702.1 ABC transporter permease [Uliginosibacterium sp. 31-12]NSL56328.1 ABC transporter permease [Uliginosibacterium aquaticum]
MISFFKSGATPPMPRWAELVLMPLVNLAIAFALAGGVVALVGQAPGLVLETLLQGAFGSLRGVSYTLYYTTSFIFTGLAVALASHGGLFNIGAEGQASIGGLGIGLLALWLSNSLPWYLMWPLLLIAGMGFGALWAAVPGYLQAWRGSHVVITTIMFNFMASALLSYLLVHQLKVNDGMAVESAPFGASAHLSGIHQVLASLGVEWPSSPLNLSFVLALGAAVAVYLLLWRSRAGFRLRAFGSSASAAEYAGINPRHQTLLAMACSGALAGMVGMNEIAGVNDKLLLDFVGGAGFTGIAVAVIGRNHPFGIVMASLLFGALFQGGAEVAFEVQGFTRDMVVMLQGLIVLVSGAMSHVVAGPVARLVHACSRREASFTEKETQHG